MIDATQACKRIAMHDATQVCKIIAMNDATQACKIIALDDISSNTNVDTFHPVNSVVSLSPFPRTPLPCNFHCISGIDFTYHPGLYINHNKWMEAILPIIWLLVSSFHL